MLSTHVMLEENCFCSWHWSFLAHQTIWLVLVEELNSLISIHLGRVNLTKEASNDLKWHLLSIIVSRLPQICYLFAPPLEENQQPFQWDNATGQLPPHKTSLKPPTAHMPKQTNICPDTLLKTKVEHGWTLKMMIFKKKLLVFGSLFSW